MKELFFMGGPQFMGVLTLLLIITTVWIVYYFIKGYSSEQVNKEKILKKIEYGKSMGLFAMVSGFLGQFIGLKVMFSVIEQAGDILPPNIFGAIEQTMICPIYGILIFLFTLTLWFAARTILESKFENK